jgi:hypothetical protein
MLLGTGALRALTHLGFAGGMRFQKRLGFLAPPPKGSASKKGGAADQISASSGPPLRLANTSYIYAKKSTHKKS